MRPCKQALLTTTTCLTALLAFAPMARANPADGIVAAGQATIISSGKKLDVHQQSHKAVIDWRSFDIAPDEHTQFHQTSSASIALNRVNSTSASRINGQLTANGNVIIVNQNGVIFGQSARVDVNGLVATTADIANDQFMNNDTLVFDKPGNPDATVVNEGQITAKEAGLVGLVAPNVVNSGTIQARLGKVQLASGDTMTVDMYGDGLLDVAVSDQIKSQLVSNSGAMQADGGTIALTAAAGKQIVNSLIINTGALQAQSIAQKNGKIIITAEGSNAVAENVKADKGKKQGSSTVLVSGTLDVSGKAAGETGGNVMVTGDNVALLAGTVIDASGYEGKSGTTAGKEKSAKREGSAGGEILIGGDYLGQGDTPTAKNLYVDSGVLVLNDALNSGDAGRTIFWSDGTTQFYGNVYARALGGREVDALTWNATAGGHTGDGGFVETSGYKHLDAGGYVDLTSSNGVRGTYFLDPTDITIYGNVDPAFQSTDNSIDLSTNLRLWLDASDTGTVSLTYSTDSLSGRTLSNGVSGSTTLTVSGDATSALVAGARIRLGGAGSTTTADTMGADTYTIASISYNSGTGLTTITTAETLGTYSSGTQLYRGLVSQLTDKSNSNASSTQAIESNMPLWLSNQQNGLGTLYLNGTSDRLDTSTPLVIQQIFSAARVDPTAAFYGHIVGNTTSDHGNVRLTIGWGDLTYGHNNGNDLGLNANYYINDASGRTYVVGTPHIVMTSGANAYTYNNLRVGSNNGATRSWGGLISDVIGYNSTISNNARNLISQYQSAKWGIALTPPGTGATEVAKATASNGYSVFTTRYLERLSQSADISLQATNNINLDFKGDTLNFSTLGRNLTLNAGNQITTASTGAITTNNGNISLTGTNGIAFSNAFALNSNGGSITLNNATTLNAALTTNSGSGTTTFGSTVNGANNLNATAGTFSFASALGGTTPLYAVSLTSTNSLTLPSISAASILARTTGASSDITIPSGKVLTASGSGTPLTLAAERNFINNAGSSALSATSGRWLVYSTNPASDTIGSLSNNFRRFSCAYSGVCPTLGSGNGLLYSYTPTLTATPSALNLTYGDAVPLLSGYAYTLSGYLGSDSGSDNVTGSLIGSTTYTQGSNVGSYSVNYGSGSLASAMGYGFIYANNATAITVAPRTLSVLPDTVGRVMQTPTINWATHTLSAALTSAQTMPIIIGSAENGAEPITNKGYPPASPAVPRSPSDEKKDSQKKYSHEAMAKLEETGQGWLKVDPALAKRFALNDLEKLSW